MYLTIRSWMLFVFMGLYAASAQRQMDADASLREELVEEVGSALGGVDAIGDFGSDLPAIEAVLLPIVVASPKNAYGRLDEAASRYVLHRYFMQQHGWDMRTFVDSKKKDEEVTCLFDFGRQVPFAVQAALEKRVVERGASVIELSVFVALLEHLIQNEIPGKVEASYLAMGFLRTDSLDPDEAEDLIDLHMALQIEQLDAAKLNPRLSRMVLEKMPAAYKGWSFARAMFREKQEEAAPDLTSYSFQDILRVVTPLENRLSDLQTHQCGLMKDKLLDLDQPGTGRVPLAMFYESALTKGNTEFTESIEYLRQLGAVDEQNVSDPRVVISNYLDGPSNCIAGSRYYSVCCLDECADLYKQLEQQLQKPVGTPEEILSVVKGLSTPVIRDVYVSDTQAERLREISQQSSGVIELHGEPFSQWMHWTFPRQCTDPSMFGPAYFMTLDEWAETSKLKVVLTMAEARKYVEDAKRGIRNISVTADEGNTSAGKDIESPSAAPGENQSSSSAVASVASSDGTPTLTQHSEKIYQVPSDGMSSLHAASSAHEREVDMPSDDRFHVDEQPANASVSKWAPLRRWAAVASVALIVPGRALGNLYAQRASQKKQTKVDMLDMQMSVIDAV